MAKRTTKNTKTTKKNTTDKKLSMTALKKLASKESGIPVEQLGSMERDSLETLAKIKTVKSVKRTNIDVTVEYEYYDRDSEEMAEGEAEYNIGFDMKKSDAKKVLTVFDRALDTMYKAHEQLTKGGYRTDGQNGKSFRTGKVEAKNEIANLKRYTSPRVKAVLKEM